MPQHDPRLEGALDVHALTSAWAPPLPTAQATAIVSVLVYVAGEQGDDVPPVGARLFEHDPSIDVSIADLGRLRGIIGRRIAEQLDGPAATNAALRMHAALDDLVAAVATRQLERLERTAMIDPLTGVGNRRAMDRELPAAVAHAARHSSRVAVAMMDLDGLKRINDSEGHAAGDDVLRTMGATLAANARAGDSVFRIGGDEFLIVARDSSFADVEHLLDRVRQQAPSFSAGIAALPEDGEDVATLLRVADGRLYAGRGGRVVVVPSASATPAERASRPHLRRGRPGVLVVLGAAMAAELVRRQSGVDVHGADLVAWTAAATVAPLALGAAGWRFRAGLLSAGVAAGTTFAGLMLLLPVLDDEGRPRLPSLAAPSAPVERPAPDGADDDGVTVDRSPAPAPAAPDPSALSPRPTVLDVPIAAVSRRPSGLVAAPSAPRPDTAGDDGTPRAIPITWPKAPLPDVPAGTGTAAIPRLEPDLGTTVTIRPAAGSRSVVAPTPRAVAENGHGRGHGRGDPHEPGEHGDPHDPGDRGDPHDVPKPGWVRRTR